MPLPNPPTNYAATVDITTVTLFWVNGANAQTVCHEYSIDNQTWHRLDDDTVPTVTSDHSLQEQNTKYYLRAKSRNAEGDSAYTPVVEVTTGEYIP